MEWQTVSGVIGLVGGLVGLATFAFRLLENHQPPRITLTKLPGDGNDWYDIEVVNPCLAPVTIRAAGISFGDKRAPMRMTEIGDTPNMDWRKTYAIVLPARGAARCSFPRTHIGQHASSCRAVPEDGFYEIAAYCDSAYGGLRRRKLRLSKYTERVSVDAAKE